MGHAWRSSGLKKQVGSEVEVLKALLNQFQRA